MAWIMDKIFDKSKTKIFSQKILIFFFNLQSKLNCEVLSRSIGLQLRWSVAAENIILQIVGNLGL